MSFTFFLPLSSYPDPTTPKAGLLRAFDMAATLGGEVTALVHEVDIADVQCNTGAAPAKLHAPAKAGSTVTLRWTLWPESHVGPMITYMARCPDTGCQDWQPGTAYALPF